MLGATDTALLRRLGFGIERADAVTSLLSASDQHRAVAVLLEAGETPDLAAPRFQNLSPASWAFDVAARRNLPWVVAVGGDSFASTRWSLAWVWDSGARRTRGSSSAPA